MMDFIPEVKNEQGQNQYITVIAKVTNLCNLQCPYCYNRVNSKKSEIMSLDTLEKILFNIVSQYQGGEIIFHGGEPLLAGYDWFKDAFELIDKYRKMYNTNLHIGIQTNGTLITPQMIQLFNQNGVTFGLSFDGRENENTRKNTKKLLSNMELMRKHGMGVGGIMLITSNNSKHLIEEFEYFNMLRISPKFNIIHNARLMTEELYENIDHENMVYDLCHFFNYYAIQENAHIQLDYFNRMVAMVTSNKRYGSRSCENLVCNFKWISVSPRGELVPCGRDWIDDYKLGNVMDLTFQEAFQTESYLKYVKEVNQKMVHCKENCDFFRYCQSGCPATSLVNTGKIDGIDSGHCMIFKKVFVHIYNYIYVEKKPVRNPQLIEIIKGGAKPWNPKQ